MSQKVINQLTDRQLLADFSRDYDLPKIYLRAHETLIQCGVKSGVASVQIRRYSVAETNTRLTYTKSGLLWRTWKLTEDDAWIENPPMMLWDEDFTPVAVAKWEPLSPQEREAKEDWARDCARPGTDRSPLYSYDRVLREVGPCPSKMTKYWGLVPQAEGK